MKIWLTTDTHFGHRAMEKYCGRPPMFEELIFNGLQKFVRPNDILIHLGDVCIGDDAPWNIEFNRVVPGIHWLLKGNHDNKSNSWYMAHGWDFVGERIQDRFFGKEVLLSHVPKKDFGDFDINIHGHFHNSLHRLLEGKYVVDGEKERNKEDLAVLTARHKLLAIENTNYLPVLLKQFI